MSHRDINIGDTFDFKFTTRDATGSPTTLSGTPAVAAYVGNSTTEITAGITLTVDFDTRTGLNNVRVVATTGNGFAEGDNVSFVITAGTVDSVSVVGEEVHSCSIIPKVNVSSGVIEANVKQVNGTAQTARDIGASVLISSGTGTGQLDVTSGVIKANLAQILGTALTETAGQIAAAFKQFFNVASPTGTMKAITNVVTTTNLTNAPTNGDLTSTMKASVTTAATAATPTAAAVTATVDANIKQINDVDLTGDGSTTPFGV